MLGILNCATPNESIASGVELEYRSYESSPESVELPLIKNGYLTIVAVLREVGPANVLVDVIEVAVM